jgi:ATP-dependent Zn protease
MRKLANATGGDAEIIASIMAEARQEILNNTSCIERISDALLASETLTGDELRAIIAA